MLLRWIMAVIALPVMVLVVIPVIIMHNQGDSRFSLTLPYSLDFWIGIIIGLFGLLLALWTTLLFIRSGEGTAAPWDPPRQFIVRGPYCYLRNPMIAGVLAILLAESLLCHSWPLFHWFLIAAGANMIYIPLIEEKGLARRFGDAYAIYRRNVPRWIPRLTPWSPEEDVCRLQEGAFRAPSTVYKTKVSDED